MRPRTLDEFVGQEHLVGPGKPLRTQIERDDTGSLIFWGPPGTGKTTLAQIIAHMTKADFIQFSAVLAGIKEIKQVMADAERARQYGTRTIVFIDEIHRFNKAQQDAFLPHVEKGNIRLIGATTENPSFEIISALLSRSRVYVLKPLTEDQIVALLRRALTDEIVQDALQKRVLLYDKAGEEHYNLISALHKSVRNSDPDAALYWLGRMLEAGEDPLYVARRLIRMASEDIGLADPDSLSVAVAAMQAVHFVGMPEGNLALAQAAVYLALAAKSNALYAGYTDVQADVQRTIAEPVPMHLRNPVTGLMRQFGYGKDYQYAHSTPDRLTDMQCLPDILKDRHYYLPTDEGFEKKLKERLRTIQEWKEKYASGRKE